MGAHSAPAVPPTDGPAPCACGRHHDPQSRTVGDPHAPSAAPAPLPTPRRPVRFLAHLLIRTYQLTLSGLSGRQCRHLPTCSAYTDEAIQRHGFWAGGWIGLARVVRCHPWGSSGFDPAPAALDPTYRWWAPWRGARWTGRHIDPATRLD